MAYYHYKECMFYIRILSPLASHRVRFAPQNSPMESAICIKWKDAVEDYILPIVMIVCFSFLYRNMNGIGAAPETTGFYENWGLMRGLLDMGAGIMAARLSLHLRDKYSNTRALRVLGTLGLSAVLLCSLFIGNTKIDFFYLIVISVSVAFAFLPSDSKIFDSGFIQSWSGLTLYMYLVHDMFRTFVFPLVFGYPESMNVRLVLLLLYMIVVTAFAFVFRFLISGILTALQPFFRAKKE